MKTSIGLQSWTLQMLVVTLMEGFSNSNFCRAFDNGTLGIPEPKFLPKTTASPLPYVLIGDQAFPLKTNMLRPYPGKNLSDKLALFYYRLSRARRIIEYSFGILAARYACSNY